MFILKFQFNVIILKFYLLLPRLAFYGRTPGLLYALPFKATSLQQNTCSMIDWLLIYEYS